MNRIGRFVGCASVLVLLGGTGGAQTLVELGVLPGDTSSWGTGLNDADEVVGGSAVVDKKTGEQLNHPFYWRQGVGMKKLPVLGGIKGIPVRINNDRVIIGYAEGPRRKVRGQFYAWSHPCVWYDDGGVWRVVDLDLGLLPWVDYDLTGSPAAINDAGWIVGMTRGANYGDNNPTLWRPRGASPRDGYDAIILPTTSPYSFKGSASGINEWNEVVGTIGVGATYRAALWTPSPAGYVRTELQPLPGGDDSRAMGINDAGQVIGISSTFNPNGTKTYHAVLWTVTSSGVTITDLHPPFPAPPNVSASDTSIPTAINELGQIVGTAKANLVVWDTTLPDANGNPTAYNLGYDGVFLPRDMNDAQHMAGSNFNGTPVRAKLRLP